MAIKALEQEPCEDAISRQSLISAFPIGDTYTLDDIIATIKFQPPVTPVRKKGKWTEHPHEWGDNWQYSEFECSICHDRAHFDTDYCPNCGAEMESDE